MEIADKVAVIGLAKLPIMMGLGACHNNGCPLDFEGLAAASYVDMVHEVACIAENIDPKSGKLVGSFHPRYAI